MRDWLARHFALSVGPKLDPLERLIDFVERVLFLREQTQGEVAIVRIRSGVGLMHAKSRSLAAFGARPKSVLGNAGHGIHHGVAKLKQLLLLLARERIKPLLTMVPAKQDGGGVNDCFSGFRNLRQTFDRLRRDPCGLFRGRSFRRHFTRGLGGLARWSRFTRGGFLRGTLLFLWFGHSVKGAFCWGGGNNGCLMKSIWSSAQAEILV